MKVMIASDGTHAHFFQRAAWKHAFNACGIQAELWDYKSVSPFDAFDMFEPDVFMGQSYNLDEATIKCIKERPHLKVGLRCGGLLSGFGVLEFWVLMIGSLYRVIHISLRSTAEAQFLPNLYSAFL